MRRFALAAFVSSLLTLGLAYPFVCAGDPATIVDDHGRRIRLTDLSPEEIDLRSRGDASRFRRTVAAIQRLQSRIEQQRSVFDHPAEHLLTADERKDALDVFAAVLDHAIALDAQSRFHLELAKGKALTNPGAHAVHFTLGFAAYVEKLSLSIALVERTINKPQFEKLFDEGNADRGVKKGAYGRLKWNVVHVQDVAKSLAAYGYLTALKGAVDKMRQDSHYGFVVDRMEDRYALVSERLTKKGVKLFGGNTVDIAKDIGHTAWFPVQAETAEWLGDTRLRAKDAMLISLEQVREAAARAQPGDIILERRNWYLSNVGLPGFWPHTALWVGSPAELTAYFADPEVEAAFGGSFSEHLQRRYPQAWAAYEKKDHEGNDRRILEAISEGVVLSAAEESIRADYVAAMRPKLSKLEKARALERAFAWIGRPYDFDFDFDTDAALVCSEVVFKAYEPRHEMKGLKLPIERVVGRNAVGPNSLVRAFDAQHGTAAEQLSFVFFLDGREAERTASFASLEAFRRSWQRPKWDVVQD